MEVEWAFGQGRERTSPGLPPQAGCQWVLKDKYLQANESSLADLRARVAQALSMAEQPSVRKAWRDRFGEALSSGFVPSGRILARAGAPRLGTMMSCFVQPLDPPLSVRLQEIARTLQSGGGVGCDFSGFPPGGGPVRLLQTLEAQCTERERTGVRRGAHMAVLRWDHPDMERFAQAKLQGGLTHFNLSVGLTDDFMKVVVEDASGVTPQAARWHILTESAWSCGEPGVLFLDTMQRENWLRDVERIVATNPCGEQPLPAYGSCCLGALDLTRFVRSPFEPWACWDEVAFRRCVQVGVRMLDRVIDLTDWPLPQHKTEALRKRRVGVGWTGLADALCMLNLGYDEPAGRAMASRMACALRDAALEASCELARELGPFPAFDPRALDPATLAPDSFMGRLPQALRDRIRQGGLRNSHLLAIAPTGSISVACADNVSPGIEPIWACRQAREVRDRDGRSHVKNFEDHAWRLYQQLKGPQEASPPHFKRAHDVAPCDHVAMVAAVAPFIDGGISKTVNLQSHTSVETVQGLFIQAWQQGLKGLTIYRSRDTAPEIFSAETALCAAPAAHSFAPCPWHCAADLAAQRPSWAL